MPETSDEGESHMGDRERRLGELPLCCLVHWLRLMSEMQGEVLTKLPCAHRSTLLPAGPDAIRLTPAESSHVHGNGW
jgi:hypothetical protein